MSLNIHDPFDETHDVYGSPTFTTYSQRLQQQAASNPVPPPLDPPPRRPSSAHSSHSSRRVRRELDIKNLPRHRIVSGRYHSNPSRPSESIPVSTQPIQSHPGGIAALSPALSEARTGTDESSFDSPHQGSRGSYWPRRSTTVSPRTVSAILFALEEAIRKPLPFTTDWEEVNASMSDLTGAGGSGGFPCTMRAQNGASRASQGPVPVSPNPPGGVRTPTDIMRQRRDREARRKAEQEARDREQEEIERRQLLEQNQQAYGAGGAGDRVSQRRPTAARPVEVPQNGRTANPAPSAFSQHADGFASSQQSRYQAESQVTAEGQGQPRPALSAAQQASGPQRQQQLPESGSTAGLQPGPGTSSKQQANQFGASQSQQQLRRVPFPHAFERWENLSSHWEGLTGYWIRKLEQNNDALEKDPISQQMARQVTDLSAAGANLFHAVVELQRLRASSERKFQRWFFDTRSELEKAKEIQGDLELQVRTERQARTDTLASLRKAESDKAGTENLLKDMRRELQISKDEARRAWEELGRREQEERNRTTSLRNGEPTLVGGVQVVPMIQGLPTRQSSTSRPQTRTGPYPGGPGPTSMGGEGQASNPTASGQYYEEQPESPTVEDPFTERRRQPVQSVPEPQGQTRHFFEQEVHDVYAPGEPGDRSYGPSVESSEPGDEEYGHYQDSQGRPIAYPPSKSDEDDDYDQGSAEDGDHYESGSFPVTSAPPQGSHRAASVDYSGSGWGMPTGWESVTPRHHHPTRLSDVLEEDEPSRTTPSRASRSSRGVH